VRGLPYESKSAVNSSFAAEGTLWAFRSSMRGNTVQCSSATRQTLTPKQSTLSPTMALIALLVAAAAVQLATAAPPVVSPPSDSGNGTAVVTWTPTVGASDYLVSAEAFTFQETLTGGALTSGGGFLCALGSVLWLKASLHPINSLVFRGCAAWQCYSGYQVCPNGYGATFSPSSHPGNVALTMNGAVSEAHQSTCPHSIVQNSSLYQGDNTGYHMCPFLHRHSLIIAGRGLLTAVLTTPSFC